MPELLLMPEIAANTEEATLTSWPIPEHQPFSSTDVIAVVETAKAAVDVEAVTDGVILKTLVSPGTDVPVGGAIALLGRPGETVDDIDAALAHLGIGAAHIVVADAPDTSTEPEANTATDTFTEAQARTATAVGSAVPSHTPAGSAQPRHFASPLARRMARDAGIELADLTGSGPHGRILRKDVAEHISRPAPPAPPVVAHPDTAQILNPPASPIPAPLDAAAVQHPGYDTIPHTKSRLLIARRLTESTATIPHFYLRGQAQVGSLLSLREELNSDAATKVSINDLIIKAVGCAHRAVPTVNAIWTPQGMRQFHSVDVGMAVAGDGGLVTPVVRNVAALSLSAITEQTRDFIQRANTRSLRPGELEGGSITVSNLGMFGTREFAAIINPPQSCILAVGAATTEAVCDPEGQIRAASLLRLTLSVDHRVIDGALAATWLTTLTDLLEHPLRILT